MPRAKKTEPLVAFKGFDENLACQGFAFEVGQSYTHEGKVKVCAAGFHACTAPFDVWSYYDLDGTNRFCRVHLSGATDTREGDSKIAAETIFIETELTLGEMIRLGVKHEIGEALKKAKTKDVNASSGNYATNASSGYGATNASSGNYATNASSGYGARNEANGKQSVIAAAGLSSIAKGAKGTAIALPYKDTKGQIRFACGVAGEKGVPADTWLKAEGGKLVKC